MSSKTISREQSQINPKSIKPERQRINFENKLFLFGVIFQQNCEYTIYYIRPIIWFGCSINQISPIVITLPNVFYKSPTLKITNPPIFL